MPQLRLTKQLFFQFIVWKDANSTRNYAQKEEIHYTVYEKPGSNYTLKQLFDYWRKNIYKTESDG